MRPGFVDDQDRVDRANKPVSSEVPLTSGDRTRHLLKHKDAFLLCNRYGDIVAGEKSEEGFYFDGTRFLSELRMCFDSLLPVHLGSHVRDQNDALVVSLTNAAATANLESNVVQIDRRTFLLENQCYVVVKFKNYGVPPSSFLVSFAFEADYADIYEIRGMHRPRHGSMRTPRIEENTVQLSYQGLDHELRATELLFTPAPDRVDAGGVRYSVTLDRNAEFEILLHIIARRSARGEIARTEVQKAWEHLKTQRSLHQQRSAHVRSSNARFTEWFERSLSDLNMMTSELQTGPYPYAGVPWFNTPFGRDGIVTAFSCLWMKPELAHGVLSYLAETQATEIIPEEDAEPGKILHEIRTGEMAALKEMPFGRYYGSVDATPLFVVLAGAYYERTGDLDFMRRLWSSLYAALEWMEHFGDADGDGFIEYRRQCSNGLIHQGWRDSDDAVFHEDGIPAEGALAVCEVQGYAYGALCAGAVIADHLGHVSLSQKFTSKAELLRERFNEKFWCEELNTYGLALDGNKRLCRVRSSSAGQCLFSGIATRDRAIRVADTLLSRDCYSGWGIRTIASSSARFNPMSYHNGSVWPHDNGLIAFGLARYGLTTHVSRLFGDVLESVKYFDRCRLPELFCGFEREDGVAPVLYPVACAPQSWAAASMFLLVQACLGLKVDGLTQQISFTHPMLPMTLPDLWIDNLQIGRSVIGIEVGGRGSDIYLRPTSDLIGCCLVRY